MEPPRGLSERERAILRFEGEWQPAHGSKEDAIRSTFGVSPARYYQLLGALLRNPDALAHDPQLVNRLIRLRDARHAVRRARISPDSQD